MIDHMIEKELFSYTLIKNLHQNLAGLLTLTLM